MTIKRVPPITWEDPNSEGSETKPDEVTTSRVSVAGESDTIPIVYGPAEVPAKIGIVTADGSTLVVLAIWCVGRIEEITQVYLNGEPSSGIISQTHYLGTTSQRVDPTLARVVSGYNDTLVFETPDNKKLGIAYSVLTIPPDVTSGFPRIKARIKGRHVHTDLSQFGYSTNPGAILVDLIRDQIIGLGRQVHIESALALIADCDEVMADNRSRREIGIVLDRQQSVERWIETLRTYASCTIGMEHGYVKLIPLWLEADEVLEVTEEDILKGSLQIGYRQAGKPATVVTVSYTDLSTEPVTSNEVRYAPDSVISGEQPWREQLVSMPGIPSRSQASREAKERFRAIWLAPLTVKWRTFDSGLHFSVGDRVNVTHPLGLTQRKFRITAVNTAAAGRWDIEAEEFNEGIRSDTTEVEPDDPTNPVPPPGDGPTQNPILQQPLENLTLTEVFSEDNLQPPQSKIKAYWTSIGHDIVAGYQVQYSSEPDVWSAFDDVALERWVSDLLPTPVVYQVRVRALTRDNAKGPWALATIKLIGKQYNLAVPPSVRTSGGGDCFNTGALPFAIRIDWTFPIDASDIATTQLHYNTVPLAEGSTFLSEHPYPARTHTVTGLSSGAKYYVFARFKDTNGNLGPWRDTNGALAAVSCNADKVMDYISGQIEETDLHKDLVRLIDNKLGPNDPALIDISQSVHGLKGQYTVKIQQGKYVAGYGLAVDPTDHVKSQFLVHADRFAIGHPSMPDARHPFIVQNGEVYIRKTLIGDAWIENAHIRNLTVDNAKLGWNAVTEGVYRSGGQRWLDGGGGWRTCMDSFRLNLSQCYGFVVLMSAQVRLKGANAFQWSRGLEARYDGSWINSVEFKDIANSQSNGGYENTSSVTLVGGRTFSVGSKGSATFSFKARGWAALGGGGHNASEVLRCNVAVFIFKK